MKKIKLSIISALAVITFYSCEKDPKPNTAPTNDSELITTIKLEFKDSSSGNIFKTVTFKDIDGEGGNAPTVMDSIVLNANTVYLCQVTLLDESKTPAENITDEIKNDADEHLFVYELTNSALQIQITDKDKNNLNLGIESVWRTKNTENSSLKLTLKHQPDGLKDGSASKGETDVEVSFPVKIK